MQVFQGVLAGSRLPTFVCCCLTQVWFLSIIILLQLFGLQYSTYLQCFYTSFQRYKSSVSPWVPSAMLLSALGYDAVFLCWLSEHKVYFCLQKIKFLLYGRAVWSPTVNLPLYLQQLDLAALLMLSASFCSNGEGRGERDSLFLLSWGPLCGLTVCYYIVCCNCFLRLFRLESVQVGTVFLIFIHSTSS